MSSNEINEMDLEDIGLKQVMGNRFQDMTQKPTVEQSSTRTTNTTPEKKMVQKPISKPMEAQWEPVKAEPSFIEKLTDTAKWICLFGGLSFLIFYWKETGLMAESIAVPSMCVCTALVGWSIGKHAIRGNR